MGHSREQPSFESPNLVALVEALTQEQIDELPFGATRLDAASTVTVYSQTDRNLSRSGDRPRLGKHFFTEIAPCFDNDDFRGRIERAQQRGTVNIEFGNVIEFPDGDQEVTVKVKSAPDGGLWIFTRYES